MFGWFRRLAGAQTGHHSDDTALPIDLAAVPGAFVMADDFPRPQWEVINGAVASLNDRYGEHRVWCEVQRQWLEAIAEGWSEGYRIIETKSILLLCCRDDDSAASLARLCENTFTAIGSVVGDQTEYTGKLPVFVFDSSDIYYSYIAYFYGDGEYGTSGGICIREGDTHVVTTDRDYGLERVLAHEMVHARLNPGLPVWVEEGAAEVISRRISRDPPLVLEPADVRRQQHHWSKRGLDAFWSGDAFQRGDRGQQLSYTLAEVLMQNLVNTRGGELTAFVADAKAADAGDAAARENLGVSLGDLVAEFLGPGDWEPSLDGQDP